MDKLEVGLGIMMKNAWHHSEAIQITDLHVLLHHVADVLEFALEHPDRVKVRSIMLLPPILLLGGMFLNHFLVCLWQELTAGDRPQFRQEFLVLHYMYSVMTQLDDNNESRYMTDKIDVPCVNRLHSTTPPFSSITSMTQWTVCMATM